jgi:hypothetical protein
MDRRDARFIDAKWLFGHCRRQLLANAAMTPSRLASYPVACDAGRVSYSFCLYDQSVMGVTDFVERPR